jgi:hypothetical protein
MISWKFRQGLLLFFLANLSAQYIPDNIISTAVQAAQNQIQQSQSDQQANQSAQPNNTATNQSPNGLQRFTDRVNDFVRDNPEAAKFARDLAEGRLPAEAVQELISRVGIQRANDIINKTVQDPQLRQALNDVVTAVARNDRQALLRIGFDYGANYIRSQTGNNPLVNSGLGVLGGAIFGRQLGNPTQAFDLSNIRVTSTGFVFDAPNGPTTINIAGMDIQSPQGIISTADFKEANDVRLTVSPLQEVLAMAETEGVDAGATVAEYAAASHLGLPMVHIASLSTSVMARLEREAGAECINRLLQLNASNPQFTRGHAIRACIEEKNRVLGAVGAARSQTAPSAQATPSINVDILDIVPVPGVAGLLRTASARALRNLGRDPSNEISRILGLQELGKEYKFPAVINVSNNQQQLLIDPSFERSVFMSEIYGSVLLKLLTQSNNPLAFFLMPVMAGQRTRFRLMLGDFIMIGASESEISTVLLTPTRGPLAAEAKFCTREARLINNFLINLNILYTLMEQTCLVRNNPNNLNTLRNADLNAYLQSPDVQKLGISTVLEKVTVDNFSVAGLDGPFTICYPQLNNLRTQQVPLNKLVDWMQLSIGQKILSEDVLAQIDSMLSKVITHLDVQSQNQATGSPKLKLACDRIQPSKAKIIEALNPSSSPSTSQTLTSTSPSRDPISAHQLTEFIAQIRKHLNFTSTSFDGSNLRSFMSSTTKINNQEIAAWESVLTLIAYELAELKVEGEVYDLADFTLQLLEQDHAAITAVKKPFGVEFDTYGAFMKALANLAVIASGNPAISTGESLNRNFKEELKQRANALIQNLTTLAKLM